MSKEFSAHVRREAATNGITNAFFNGAIAWLLVRNRTAVPVWGQEGLAVDFAATSLILVFIVTLIVIPLARRKVARGEYPGAVWQAGVARTFLDFMARRNLLVCALLLGLMSVLLFVPPVLLLTELLGIPEFTAAHFALLKGFWAGLVAAGMVAVMLGIVAMAQSIPKNSGLLDETTMHYKD